jgi:hypothetical protein
MAYTIMLYNVSSMINKIVYFTMLGWRLGSANFHTVVSPIRRATGLAVWYYDVGLGGL